MKRFLFITVALLLLSGVAAAQTGRFEPVKLADHPEAAACEIGPDGHLYVVSCQRRPGAHSTLTRYRLDARGEYTGRRETVYTWSDQLDLALGLTFAPESTAEKLIAYVSVNNNYRSQNNGHKTNPWGGRIERLIVAARDKVKVEKVIINLPIGFHAVNDLTFGPDGLLYICAGSTTTSGGAGVNTAEHPEQLFSAAVLQADLSKIDGTLDVKTASGGRYNPYAKDAPVRLYATAIRQPWDCVWHPNGKFYTCTNQNDVNGRTGGGPGIPDLHNIKPPEYLAILEKGKTYGFPNPSRGEYVLMGGNPAADSDAPWRVPQYPVGIKPPKTWEPALLHRIDTIGGGSADGMIVYHSPGVHQGKLMVCFFGNNGKGRIWTFTPGKDGRIIAQEPLRDTKNQVISIWDCLDLCEHPACGQLYVSKYGSQNGLGKDGQVWMLRRHDPLHGERLAFKGKVDPAPAGLTPAPPVVDAGADIEQVPASFPITLQLKGNVQSDGPADKIQVKWSLAENASGGKIELQQPEIISTRVRIHHAGRYTFQLAVNDGERESSSTVTVVLDAPGNKAPVVALGNFPRKIRLGETLTLSGSATDDGLPRPPGKLRYTWSRIGPGVGVAHFADPNARRTKVTFSEPSVYLLRLTADDGVRTAFAETTVIVSE